jgi:predicted Zn-dependent protease
MRAFVAGAALFCTACAQLQAVGINIQPPNVGALAQQPEKFRQCDEFAAAPIPIDEEYALGGALAVQFVGGTPLVLDGGSTPSSAEQLNVYLNVVGKNLAAQSQRPMLDWTFGIIDQADPNAFSTPGGYVFVSKGLLKQLDNEAQLAGILGHEIGHVTLKHAMHQYQSVKAVLCKKDSAMGSVLSSVSTNTGLNLNDVANAAALGKLTDQLATTLHNLGYGKDDELEADRTGAELALSAGYNPHELSAYLQRLPAGSAVFSHHPPPAERQKALEDWISSYCGKKESLLAESDCPFTSYPKVEFPAAIKAAIAGL